MYNIFVRRQVLECSKEHRHSSTIIIISSKAGLYQRDLILNLPEYKLPCHERAVTLFTQDTIIDGPVNPIRASLTD